MNKKIKKNKGFSLVEFVVILSIFAIMASVSSINYNEHRAAIEMSNISQDVALTIRQAQVYGISASSKKLGGDTFDASAAFSDSGSIPNVVQDKSIRGVSFNLDEGTITLFEDIDGNKRYVAGNLITSDRVIDVRKIVSRDVSMEYFYVCLNGACTKKTHGVLDISFQRPYADAIITFTSGLTGSLYDHASIIVSNGGQKNKYVEVSSIGNINVKSNHDI